MAARSGPPSGGDGPPAPNRSPSSSTTFHTARPEPSPIVIPGETSSTAAAAAAARAASSA